MRDLSDFEKKLINKMISGEGDNIQNLIDEYIKDEFISIDLEKKQVEINFPMFKDETLLNQKDALYILNRTKEIITLILTTVNLIQYLENEGYIYLYEKYHTRGSKTIIGGGAINVQKIINRIPDKIIKNILIKYVQKNIIVTQVFRNLVKNKFKTQSQIKHIQNLRATYIAIIVSILLGITGIYLNYLKSNKSLTIDENQFGTISQELENLSNKIDTLNNINKENAPKDTLKIDIINSTK